MSEKNTFARNLGPIYSKFILSAGFIAFAVYNYMHHNGDITLKAIACTVVGIAYLAFGVYNVYKK